MWHFKMLGRWTVSRGSERLGKFPTEKTGILLARLARATGAMRRESLCAYLWPDAEPTSARNSLRTALAWLRGRLETEDGYRLFESDKVTLALLQEAFTTDLDEFQALTREASETANPQEKIDCLSQAACLIRGTFLEGCFDPSDTDGETSGEWIAGERQLWDTRCFEVLMSLAQLEEACCSWRPALEYALRALVFDPYNASLLALALRVSERAGNLKPLLDFYHHHRNEVSGPDLPAALEPLLAHFHQLEQARQKTTPSEKTALENALTAHLPQFPASVNRFLQRLCVFPAPFTAAQAVEVCTEPEAEQLLALLLERGFVLPSDAPSSAFYVPDVLRAFLSARLAKKDKTACQKRHARLWLRIAEELFQRYGQAGPGEGQKDLPRLQPHFEAAFAFLLASDWTLAYHLHDCLLVVYHPDGDCLLNAWTRQLLALPHLTPGERISLLFGMAWQVEGEEGYQAILQNIEESLAQTEAGVHYGLLAKALYDIGIRAHHREDDSTAETALLACLDICRREERRHWQEVWTQGALYECYMAQGKLEQARECLETAWLLMQSGNLPANSSFMVQQAQTVYHYRSGGLLAKAGDYPTARKHLYQAIEGFRAERDRHGEADCLRELAKICLHQDLPMEARLLTEQSMNHYEAIGNKESRAAALGDLGDVLKQQKQYERARSCYEEGLSVWKERGHQRWQAIFLARLAKLPAQAEQ